MELNSDWWNNRYTDQSTTWDAGSITTPLEEYIDQLTNKQIKVLIPGCGNSYEAAYLLKKGFPLISMLDISSVLCDLLQQKFAAVPGTRVNIICDDFFNHKGTYDLIIEQTFFCALNPDKRISYIEKMHNLLMPGGKLIGLLFDRDFVDGPPFGGSIEEYKSLFGNKFLINKMEPCYNSIPQRSGTELFINLRPKEQVGK
ncbi:MAG: methyltransferase [Ferruginibacter sp.]